MIRIVGIVSALAGLLTLLAGVVDVTVRVETARTALMRAEQTLKSFKSEIGQHGASSTRALYGTIDADTARASSAVNGPVWDLAEHMPGLGTNLRAVRQVTRIVRGLVVGGVKPLATTADGLSMASLKPSDGRIDVTLITRLERPVADLDDALRAASAETSHIDTAGTVSDIRDAVSTLRRTIGEAQPITAEVRAVMPVLYPALGGDGARHYLLSSRTTRRSGRAGATRRRWRCSW